jgi:hypothetical protein
VKYILTAFILAVGILNYVYQTATEYCNYREVFYKNNPVFQRIHITCVIKNELQVPYDKDWEIMPILQYMENSKPTDSDNINVLMAVDHHLLNHNIMELYSKLGKLKGTLHSNFVTEGLADRDLQEDEIEGLIKRSHFVITKNGFQGPDFSNTNNAMVHNLLKDSTPVKSFAMSDSSAVFIYPGFALKEVRFLSVPF